MQVQARRTGAHRSTTEQAQELKQDLLHQIVMRQTAAILNLRDRILLQAVIIRITGLQQTDSRRIQDQVQRKDLPIHSKEAQLQEVIVHQAEVPIVVLQIREAIVRQVGLPATVPITEVLQEHEAVAHTVRQDPKAVHPLQEPVLPVPEAAVRQDPEAAALPAHQADANFLS